MTSYTQTDFSGGISDNYLSCAPNCYKLSDNLSIDANGKLHTRWGTFAYASQAANRISGVYVGNAPFGSPLAFSGPSVYFANSSNGWTEILGPASSSACPGKAATDVEKALIWRRQLVYVCGNSGNTVLPHRIYCSNSSVPSFTALTLGLPSANPTIVFSSTPGSNNYQYIFHFDYQFTDYQGTLFEEKGPVWGLSTIVGAEAPNTTPITIQSGSLPVISNTSSTNYDTANIKIYIFRTINNGQTFYRAGQVTNGTTIFVDSMSDATLQTKEQLYTNGGVLPYSQPPVGSKFTTQVNDYFWYATDSMITHSVVGGPGECPTLYYQPMPQKIQGLSDILSFPILFCDRSVYRVDGVFDELGNGGFTLYEISQTAGCISNKSIVKIPGGLVWIGNGGFYFTDGYQVINISQRKLPLRAQAWKNAFNAGAYDSIRNQVVWSISSFTNSNTYPCDSFAVLHLNYGISMDSVFTTWSSANNIFPTAIAFSESLDVPVAFRSKLLIGEARGYLLYQDPNAYTDPKIDALVLPSAFIKKVILYRYESMALDLGGDALKKYCVDLTAELSNDTNIAIQFLSRRDDGGPWGVFSEIRNDIPATVSTPAGSGAMLWDIAEYAWNDPNDTLSHDWDSQSLVEGRRFFPQGTLRSTRRQIGFTNSYTFVAISDVKGLASISAASQVSLNSGVWPYDCEDYYIGIDILLTGAYTYYQIKSRISDSVISICDPFSTFPSSLPVNNIKWQIQGYRKFERANVLSYTVNFDEGSNTQSPSQGTAGLVNG